MTRALAALLLPLAAGAGAPSEVRAEGSKSPAGAASLVERARKLAEERGFDPNFRSNNVEVAVAEKAGMETVTYVGNIYKYYIAYKLLSEIEREREKAKAGAKP